MCDYCDCRTRPLLARLGEDHGRILALVGTIERLAATGATAADAHQPLAELAELLVPHSAAEEEGFYVELAHEGIDTEGLSADHDHVDGTLRDAARGDATAWAVIPQALMALRDHIRREEYDLFPAAHQLLSSEAWDRIDAATPR